MNSNLDWAPMPEPLSPDQITAARSYVCARANDAAEAGVFLDMLGIEVAT